jgi:hypothetical protein
MSYRVAGVVGALLGVLGLAAGAASFALPWARVSARGTASDAPEVAGAGGLYVLNLPQGTLYLGSMLLLAGALALSWLSAGPMRRGAGTAAVLLAVATGVLISAMRASVHTAGGRFRPGLGDAEMRVTTVLDVGIYAGAGAAALLGVGAALLSVARPRG